MQHKTRAICSAFHFSEFCSICGLAFINTFNPAWEWRWKKQHTHTHTTRLKTEAPAAKTWHLVSSLVHSEAALILFSTLLNYLNDFDELTSILDMGTTTSSGLMFIACLIISTHGKGWQVIEVIYWCQDFLEGLHLHTYTKAYSEWMGLNFNPLIPPLPFDSTWPLTKISVQLDICKQVTFSLDVATIQPTELP